MIGPAGTLAAPKQDATKYPLLPRQSIEYDVLHALEVGYICVSDIETYLRDSGKAIYPRQVSGALQRLRRSGIAAHKNAPGRGRWQLTPNAQVQAGPAGFMAGIAPATEI